MTVGFPREWLAWRDELKSAEQTARLDRQNFLDPDGRHRGLRRWPQLCDRMGLDDILQALIRLYQIPALVCTDRPAPMTRQLPDSPADFLESGRGYLATVIRTANEIG
jgi:hypothetical protein